MLERMIRGPRFAGAADEAKRRLLQDVSSRASEAVRTRAVRAVTQGRPLVFDQLVSAGLREQLTRDRRAVLGRAAERPDRVAAGQ